MLLLVGVLKEAVSHMGSHKWAQMEKEGERTVAEGQVEGGLSRR